jgi:hypothetical protein
MRWRVLEIGAGGGGPATALPGKPVKSVVVQDSSQNLRVTVKPIRPRDE